MSVVVGVVIPAESCLGVDVFAVFLERRPVAEVLAREIARKRSFKKIKIRNRFE